jgi:hypothetical protein
VCGTSRACTLNLSWPDPGAGWCPHRGAPVVRGTNSRRYRKDSGSGPHPVLESLVEWGRRGNPKVAPAPEQGDDAFGPLLCRKATDPSPDPRQKPPNSTETSRGVREGGPPRPPNPRLLTGLQHSTHIKNPGSLSLKTKADPRPDKIQNPGSGHPSRTPNFCGHNRMSKNAAHDTAHGRLTGRTYQPLRRRPSPLGLWRPRYFFEAALFF